jgi:hypothetical protein
VQPLSLKESPAHYETHFGSTCRVSLPAAAIHSNFHGCFLFFGNVDTSLCHIIQILYSTLSHLVSNILKTLSLPTTNIINLGPGGNKKPRAGILLFTTTSWAVQRSAYFGIKCVPGTLLMGVNLAGAGHCMVTRHRDNTTSKAVVFKLFCSRNPRYNLFNFIPPKLLVYNSSYTVYNLHLK